MSSSQASQLIPLACGIAVVSLSVGIAGTAVVPRHAALSCVSALVPLSTTAEARLVNEPSTLIESTGLLLTALPQANRSSDLQAADFYFLPVFYQWLRQFFPPVPI